MSSNCPMVTSILEENSEVGEGFKIINPYAGCSHGCVYCFAYRRALKYSHFWWGNEFKVLNYSDWRNARPIGNAVELVEKELNETQDGIKSILLSSITDAYQPLERELELTRSILEIFTEHRIPYLIVTKSDLVLRDLDLISKGQGVVQFSITCEPGYQAKEFWEPYSSSIEQRIEAIKTLHENGIPTAVNVCPILPLSNPIEIIDLLRDDVDWWVFNKLNDYKIDNKWYVQTKKRIIEHAELLGLQYTIKRGF